MGNRMPIGEQIKTARERKGMSQQGLSNELTGRGVKASIRTIRNWEAGRTEPRWSDVCEVRDVLAPYLEIDKEVAHEQDKMESAPGHC